MRIDLKTFNRMPANLQMMFSEVPSEVLAAFPEAPGQQRATGPEFESKRNVFGHYAEVSAHAPRGDQGSAARFYYSAKADSDDRIGSRHPTVKPVDLMMWLVRLVTPKGGLVLDPFAGSGSTGEAAWAEGMRCILIEREAKFCDDIRRRLNLVMCGPDERQREAIKASGKAKPLDVETDDIPLFKALV